MMIINICMDTYFFDKKIYVTGREIHSVYTQNPFTLQKIGV